ncbi:4-hydroxy-tetrahydrodipicolinate synthase [Corynebacterium sp. sy017]|uniref:4-hydroxy-tetrahydrodipicolinate synthase n=1 Tax=unclassified Corynebacterium TaxID=2624378 RepID=UPI001186373C|nr:MULTISPECIES: 4-hydroxy-tetrahydrodipicolinate synthase [unclassified Corynebacterium]MBP3087814.1 4-hydroxy-tetrahydrodipicolinate synthase [Corynebacterium sp. sy017]TSD92359.1 4-hydroxy-tetrahydrodipicolinate synthase [Corynebacterium sp. SY003]
MSTGLTDNTSAYFGTVSVAMVTPFDETGAVDLIAARHLAAHLVDNGVDSIVLSGTTGEAPVTTVEEKLNLLKAVKAEVGERASIVAGAGTNNTVSSVELARASVEAGADALLVVTPYYSRPSQEGIYQHIAAIADATDAPISLYDIPSRSSVALERDTICRLAELPTIQAMKDAKGNFVQATTLMRETGLSWYSGDDPLNIPWLSLGAVGFISVIGHLAPRQLRDVHTRFLSGDLPGAQEINAQLSPLVAAQARLGGVSFVKAALSMQGINVGEPRLPNIAPCEQEREHLRRDLEKAGVL